ncbi:MAG: hypothetical protein ACJAVG_001138 [Rickettsiales bacterium]|jgi:hypothetical protein
MPYDEESLRKSLHKILSKNIRKPEDHEIADFANDIKLISVSLDENQQYIVHTEEGEEKGYYFLFKEDGRIYVNQHIIKKEHHERILETHLELRDQKAQLSKEPFMASKWNKLTKCYEGEYPVEVFTEKSIDGKKGKSSISQQSFGEIIENFRKSVNLLYSQKKIEREVFDDYVRMLNYLDKESHQKDVLQDLNYKRGYIAVTNSGNDTEILGLFTYSTTCMENGDISSVHIEFRIVDPRQRIIRSERQDGQFGGDIGGIMKLFLLRIAGNITTHVASTNSYRNHIISGARAKSDSDKTTPNRLQRVPSMMALNKIIETIIEEPSKKISKSYDKMLSEGGLESKLLKLVSKQNKDSELLSIEDKKEGLASAKNNISKFASERPGNSTGSQIERVRNYTEFYADDEINNLLESRLPEATTYINPAISLIPESFHQSLQDFKAGENHQAIIVLSGENHFTGIHIIKGQEEGQVSINYFDPVVLAENIPAHKIPDHVLNALSDNFEVITITTSSTIIQTHADLDSESIEIDNNHCGAFVTHFMTQMAQGDARIDPNGVIQIRDENAIRQDGEWSGINNLSRNQSDILGVQIRQNQVEFLQGNLNIENQNNLLQDLVKFQNASPNINPRLSTKTVSGNSLKDSTNISYQYN